MAGQYKALQCPQIFGPDDVFKMLHSRQIVPISQSRVSSVDLLQANSYDHSNDEVPVWIRVALVYSFHVLEESRLMKDVRKKLIYSKN